MNVLKKALEVIDFYAYKPHLFFNSKPKYSTKLSLICTCLTLAFFMFILVDFSSDSILKQSPSTNLFQYQSGEVNQKEIKPTEVNFLIGIIDVLNPKDIRDYSRYRFEAWLEVYQVVVNETTHETSSNLTKTPLNLTKCKREFLPNTPKIMESLDNINIENYFCLDKNSNFSLGGAWGTALQKTMYYKIYFEENSTSPEIGIFS